MGIKRHRPEEIVTKLRQVEVLVGQGLARIDAIRQVQITEQTFYRWRKQYGGMGTAQLKELKRVNAGVSEVRLIASKTDIDY
jgi:transposase